MGIFCQLQQLWAATQSRIEWSQHLDHNHRLISSGTHILSLPLPKSFRYLSQKWTGPTASTAFTQVIFSIQPFINLLNAFRVPTCSLTTVRSGCVDDKNTLQANSNASVQVRNCI